jgi:hypothetical protein
LKAHEDREKPMTIHELQSLLWMANYNMQFVFGYLKIVAPLKNLLRRTGCGSGHISNRYHLKRLKKRLLTSIMLQWPDYDTCSKFRRIL